MRDKEGEREREGEREKYKHKRLVNDGIIN